MRVSSLRLSAPAQQQRIARPVDVEPGPVRRPRFGGASLLDDARFVIDFSAPVLDQTVAQVTSILQKMAFEKKATRDSGSIKMIINSPGGSIDAGHKLIGVIKNLDVPVDTIVMGSAASMGAALSIAAASKGRRFMDRYSTLMVHQPSVMQLGGNSEDVMNYALEMQRKRDLMDSLISRHTGMPMDKVQELTRKDTFIYPLEALKNGFVDWVLISGDKGLNKDSLKSLSDADIQKRDRFNQYDDLPLHTIDPKLSNPMPPQRPGKGQGGGLPPQALMDLLSGGADGHPASQVTVLPGSEKPAQVPPHKDGPQGFTPIVIQSPEAGERGGYRKKIEIMA